jgi:aryl-alcohol dehydrogenase-like predicted oxidoreductase
MEQRPLGRSGLVISRLGLGTMTWGRDTDADDAARQLKSFLDSGGSMVDTADRYADGDSERILGRLLAPRGAGVPRSALVLATKAGSPTGPGPMDRGCSRGHLLAALDASLERLGTSYLDLWQLHVWDPITPLAETLAALDAAVASGRVRYVGVSNYVGWQTATAATWQRAWPGRTPLVATQVEYSLLARGVEREVIAAAQDAGLGVLPWSPLGRGVLTGKYRRATPADSRAASSSYKGFVAPYLDERSAHIVEAVCTAAEGLSVTPLAVALAWVRDQPGVAAPIVGARTWLQLRAALDSEQLTLPSEIRRALDDVSTPTTRYPERGPRSAE